jgi:peptidoglycan/LPS O-acetylase OafA/YrhL
MSSKNIQHEPALDHLRAFAALLIVLYHGRQMFEFRLRTGHEGFSLDNWPSSANPLQVLLIEGHTAVSLFLVLSGFIFTHGCFDKQLDPVGFLRNRALRTGPLFVVLFLFALTLGRVPWTPSDLAYTALLQWQLTTWLQSAPFIGVAWTIAIEWQFYLAFPMLLRVLQRRGWRALALLIGAFIALRGAAYLHTGNSRDLAYGTIFGRLDQLLLGMLAARAWAASRARALPRLVLFVGGVLAVLAWTAYLNLTGGWPDTTHVRVLWPTLEGAAWALFVFGYLGVAPRVPALLGRALTFVGERSYSIYLLHYGALQLLIRHDVLWQTGLEPEGGALLNTVVVALPVILAASSLSFAAIEAPFLDLRGSYSKPATAGGTA